MDGFQDDSHHAIDVIHYIVIPETENAIAVFFEICGAFCIIFFLIEVLAAIQFDDEFLARGTKIGDIRTDCMLVAEMNSIPRDGRVEISKVWIRPRSFPGGVLWRAGRFLEWFVCGAFNPPSVPPFQNREWGETFTLVGITYFVGMEKCVRVVRSSPAFVIPKKKGMGGDLCSCLEKLFVIVA